ncbi:hypothetical protein C0Q70_00637 [Pomacea canaliculata]|uniref:JmjC domain-containing protein n=1 Tax=Pomacea canaliculata TaxID=400727 RepID=A0A2T7PXA7_POMCA|nr:hypothetical protein C0Q70_00637 [Pomacea canaliculata]
MIKRAVHVLEKVFTLRIGISQDYDAYSTCSFFRSDWLNEFWDKRDDVDDDYRFVYMGPKGTWTPFHADLILRACAGMDYTEFFRFMCCIARNRIQSLDMFKKQHLVLHANINMHSEIVENLPYSSCDETNSETQSESAPCCFKEDTIFVSLEAIPTNIVTTLSEPSVSKHHKYIHKTDPAEQQWEAPNKYSSREPFSCHTSTVVSCKEGFHRAEEWDKTKSYRMCKCPGKRTSPLPTSVVLKVFWF